MALDAVSLIRSQFAEEADWLKQSGAVVQIWTAALLLLSTLRENFLQEKAPAEADDAERGLWRVRLENARQRLQEAGIEVADDFQRGRELYQEQRGNWDHLVRLVGSSMAYEPAEIDTALHLKSPG